MARAMGALPTTFVEVKHKCDGRGVKRRVRVSLEDALTIASGQSVATPLSDVDRRIADEVHKLVHERNFQPCICMRYDRQAFAGSDPANDLRITFDTGVAYRFDDLTPVPDDHNFQVYLHEEGVSVMEVKVTGTVPYWLAKMLAENGCVLQSHSKYCNSLEIGDTVLRRHLYGGPKKFGMADNSAAAATAPQLAQAAA